MGQQCPLQNRIIKLIVKLTGWLWAKWEVQPVNWDYELTLQMSILRHSKAV